MLQSPEMGTIESLVRSSRKQGKLFTVDDKEKSAVEQLIKATWQKQFVGHGKDALGLSHTNIQVSISAHQHHYHHHPFICPSHSPSLPPYIIHLLAHMDNLASTDHYQSVPSSL